MEMCVFSEKKYKDHSEIKKETEMKVKAFLFFVLVVILVMIFAAGAVTIRVEDIVYPKKDIQLFSSLSAPSSWVCTVAPTERLEVASLWGEYAQVRSLKDPLCVGWTGSANLRK